MSQESVESVMTNEGKEVNKTNGELSLENMIKVMTELMMNNINNNVNN